MKGGDPSSEGFSFSASKDPWLRIERGLRAILTERWTSEQWKRMRVEIPLTGPGSHSLARAPHDSKPVIEVQHEGAPCLFTVEFGAGTHSAERVLMRAEAQGVYQVPGVVHKDELLFARTVIPSGHLIKVIVRWHPIKP